MKVPTGYSQEQVIEIITRQVKVLAPSFSFGFYGIDDIEQEAFIFAIELLNKDVYDNCRPLENFIYAHLKNRLLNLWRNRIRRSDSPCKACHECGSCQQNGKPCKKYADWLKRNNCKANLVRPLDINHLSDDFEPRVSINQPSTVETDVEIRECLELIDEKLPVELRSDYLKMREGAAIPKARRLEVEAAVKAILGDAIP